MKIKEEIGCDTIGRQRIFNIYNCDSCGIEYRKQKRQAEGAKQEHFCSTKCYKNIDTSFHTELICAHCGSLFTRLKSKLKNSKHGIYFCCRECKDHGQSYIKEIQPEHYGSGDSHYREKALKYLEKICCVCGYTNEDALVVHHIDHNRSNNLIENLQIMCSNCHVIYHKKFNKGA